MITKLDRLKLRRREEQNDLVSDTNCTKVIQCVLYPDKRDAHAVFPQGDKWLERWLVQHQKHMMLTIHQCGILEKISSISSVYVNEKCVPFVVGRFFILFFTWTTFLKALKFKCRLFSLYFQTHFKMNWVAKSPYAFKTAVFCCCL